MPNLYQAKVVALLLKWTCRNHKSAIELYHSDVDLQGKFLYSMYVVGTWQA